MGLTIHYEFQLNSASIAEVRKKITALHKVALKLPFSGVDELVELQGEECKFDKDNVNDPHIFLKIRGLKPMEIVNGFSALDLSYLIGFNTMPGNGCESAAFGLATGSEPALANDWIWTGFCKTQYASNPEYGGIENFLNSHLMIIRMLESAQKLGIICSVTDEGHYWETRSIETLVSKVGELNMLIAALAGKTRDNFHEQVYAPIFEYPNFEYLEAEGNEHI